MPEQALRFVSSGGLVIGSALGMGGTFVPSASVRGLLWGLDGVTLIVATAFLTIHYLRTGSDVVAAGFLVFVVGQALILSSAALAVLCLSFLRRHLVRLGVGAFLQCRLTTHSTRTPNAAARWGTIARKLARRQ
jgi:hypothetical protein